MTLRHTEAIGSVACTNHQAACNAQAGSRELPHYPCYLQLLLPLPLAGSDLGVILTRILPFDVLDICIFNFILCNT